MNVYLLKADPLTLIDTGPLTREAEESLIEGFKQHGYRIEDLRTIIITHGHPDHFGLAPRLRELSGANIYLFESERRKLDAGLPAILEARQRLLRDAGLSERAIDAFQVASDESSRYVPRLENAIGVRDGHVFRYENFALRALHVTGHSSGHICLYAALEGILFAGDQILSEITPNPLMEPSDEEMLGRRRSLMEYLESLKLLRELSITLVLPGHGETINDHVAAIDHLFTHHAQRAEAIYNLLNGEGQTAYSLALQLFPGLRGFEVLLGVSEVLAHMDILMAERRVVVKRSEHGWSNRENVGTTGPTNVYYRSGR